MDLNLPCLCHLIQKAISYNKEYLYNLDEDPEEKTDLRNSIKDEELLKELRSHLTRIYDNERVCWKNRAWDK